MAKLSDFILIGAIGLGAYAIYKWGGLGSIIGGIPGAIITPIEQTVDPGSFQDNPIYTNLQTDVFGTSPRYIQQQKDMLAGITKIGRERQKTLAARRTVRGIGRHGKRFNLLLKARRSKGLSPGATRFIQQYQRKYYLMNKGRV